MHGCNHERDRLHTNHAGTHTQKKKGNSIFSCVLVLGSHLVAQSITICSVSTRTHHTYARCYQSTATTNQRIKKKKNQRRRQVTCLEISFHSRNSTTLSAEARQRFWQPHSLSAASHVSPQTATFCNTDDLWYLLSLHPHPATNKQRTRHFKHCHASRISYAIIYYRHHALCIVTINTNHTAPSSSCFLS